MGNQNYKVIADIAEAVSFNESIAKDYLSKNNVDIDKFINRGFEELEASSSKTLSKSQSFFRRAVLAARIADEYNTEWTFGSVKFQKMVYLCEQTSNMDFCTNYSKQAAGPMDNKFMHSIKKEFKKQGWFNVEKVKKGKYEKYEFTPLEKIDNYKKYYVNYYQETESNINTLLDIFRSWKTEKVELIATIYACWNEIIQEHSIFSDELIINKVYAWNKSKKKFSEAEITTSINWMREKGIYPNR